LAAPLQPAIPQPETSKAAAAASTNPIFIANPSASPRVSAI
jgi:hypothetical protein